MTNALQRSVNNIKCVSGGRGGQALNLLIKSSAKHDFVRYRVLFYWQINENFLSLSLSLSLVDMKHPKFFLSHLVVKFERKYSEIEEKLFYECPFVEKRII